jgi:hypothetical protein
VPCVRIDLHLQRTIKTPRLLPLSQMLAEILQVDDNVVSIAKRLKKAGTQPITIEPL